MTNVVVAPCSHKAATYAVKSWHYSKTMPAGKIYKLGVWEDDRFVGVVLFAWGVSNSLGAKYGLKMTECVELVRVACRTHTAPITSFVSLALSKLRQDNPKLRLVISFADPYRGHVGRIYQAGNWFYLGKTSKQQRYILPNGTILHARSFGARQFGQGPSSIASLPLEAKPIIMDGKFRYAMPLDKPMRRQIAKLSLPYETSIEGSQSTTLVSGSEGQQ